MKNIITLTTTLLLLGSSLFGQATTWYAGTDFVADLLNIVSGSPLQITQVMLLLLVPMPQVIQFHSGLIPQSICHATAGEAFFTFTTNAGHSATSSFSTSVFDSTFGGEDIISDSASATLLQQEYHPCFSIC